MESARSTKPQTISSTVSERSTNLPRATFATERAKLLFGCYRRADANDPDGYIAAIAAVLSLYDADLIKLVTDPRTGISTHEKFRAFPPNSGELKAYCDERGASQARHRTYAALPPARPRLPPPDAAPGDWATVFVPPTAPQYQAMLDRAREKHADPREFKGDHQREGIWVSPTWLGAR